MGCDFIKLGDGTSVVLCGRGQRGKKCKVTGCTARATHQCDFPLSGEKAGQTCDKDLCRAHAIKQADVTPFPRVVPVQLVPGGEILEVTIAGELGETVDFCPAHHAAAERASQQRKLPGVG